MKKIILSIAIFFLVNTQSFGHVEHYAKYNYLEYELFRNNNSIGYHKYDFKRDGDDLSIISEVSFKITKLGVDLYKYFAKSEENYEKGVFKSYSSKTKQNKKIKLGICGEHGGDPKSIEFCSRTGLNYVSCSPFRVPVARLAAAQAELSK